MTSYAKLVDHRSCLKTFITEVVIFGTLTITVLSLFAHSLPSDTEIFQHLHDVERYGFLTLSGSGDPAPWASSLSNTRARKKFCSRWRNLCVRRSRISCGHMKGWTLWLSCEVDIRFDMIRDILFKASSCTRGPGALNISVRCVWWPSVLQDI